MTAVVGIPCIAEPQISDKTARTVFSVLLSLAMTSDDKERDDIAVEDTSNRHRVKCNKVDTWCKSVCLSG